MRWLFEVTVDEAIQQSEAGQPILAADAYTYRLLYPLFADVTDTPPIRGSVGHLYPDWAE